MSRYNFESAKTSSGVLMSRKQTVAAERAHEHQHRADHAAGNERRVDRRLEVIILLRAEKQRRQNRTRDVAAEGKGDENERNFVAVADGGEGVVADEFAGTKLSGDVIELLENDAASSGRQNCQSLLGLPLSDPSFFFFSRLPSLERCPAPMPAKLDEILWTVPFHLPPFVSPLLS